MFGIAVGARTRAAIFLCAVFGLVFQPNILQNSSVLAAETPVTLDASVSTTSQYTLSNGNLTFTYVSTGTTDRGGIPATDAISQGKWYWEQTIEAIYTNRTSGTAWVGLIAPTTSKWKPTSSGDRMDKQNNVYMYKQTGVVKLGTGGSRVTVETLASWKEGDVIGIAYDADIGAFWVSVNGIWQNGAVISDIENGYTSGAIAQNISGSRVAFAGAVTGYDEDSQTVTFNFGATDFTHSIPAGFEPYARPGTSNPDPNEYPGEGSADGPAVITYQYDVHNRLKVANYLNTGTQYVHKYDASGNRTSRAVKGIDIPEVKILSGRGLEGDGEVIHDLWLTEIPLVDISVDWEITPGSATYPGDYTAETGSLTIPAGERAPYISVPLGSDGDKEGDETYQITLTAAEGATIVVGDMDSAEGTIMDDDLVYFQASDVEATSEGAMVPVVISKQGTHTENVSLTVALASGNSPTGNNAEAGLDYDAVLYTDQAGTQPLSGSLVFTTTDSTHTVYVKTLDDDEYEGEEILHLSLAWAVEGYDNSSLAVITIPDNETPVPPTFSVESVAAMEGENLEFVIRKSVTSVDSFSVDYATALGTELTDAQEEDFEAVSGTADFAGSLEGEVWTKKITVKTVDDSEFEQAENVYFRLDNATFGATIETPEAIGRIENNDGTPLVNVFNASITEGDEGQKILPVTIFLAGGAQEDVTLTYYSEDSIGSEFSATAGEDYVPVGDKTVVIPAGDYEYTFNVTILSDTIFEGDETFMIKVKNPVGADLVGERTIPQNPEKQTPGLMTIREDDPGALSFSVADAAATEGDEVTFVISKSYSVEGDYTVDYATALATGDAAASSGDFTAVSGTLTFRGSDAGEEDMAIELKVPTDDDADFEQAEIFHLNLTNPSEDAAVQDGQATGKIENNDGFPYVNVFNGTVLEGDGENKTLTVTIFLVGGAQEDVSLTYYTVDGSAEADKDYVPISDTTITIPAGSYEYSFDVAILPDMDAEGDESFTVDVKSLQGARYGSIGDIPQNLDKATPATITIKDNDDLTEPVFSVNNVSSVEGTPLYFVVTRQGPSTGAYSVEYATSAGTAEGDDYSHVSDVLNFADGMTSKTIVVHTDDDDIYEPTDGGTDTVMLTLSNASVGASIGDDTGIGTITHSTDAAPQITINKTNGIEGSKNLLFAIKLTNASELSHSVDYQTVDGTAKAADGDYIARQGTVTFNPGVTFMQRTVIVEDDNEYEGDETVSFKISNATGGAEILEDEQSALIEDDETPTTAGFSVNDTNVAEGGVLTFTVTRSGLTTGSYSVDYATTNNTAENDDYTSTSGQLTFATGETEKTVAVQTTDDDVYEPSDGGQDKVNLTLSNATGSAIISDGTGVGTITSSEDLAPSITMTSASGTEGGSHLLYAIKLSVASELSHSVDYQTLDGSAKVADGDYTARQGTVTFDPGVTFINRSVFVTDDTEPETDETVSLYISNATGGASILESTETAIIKDNDTAIAPSFSVSDESVAEGGLLTFTVTRSGSAAGSYSIDYATSNDTAESDDYTSTSGTLTFADGETSKTVSVQTAGDTVYEPANSGEDKLNLTISNASGGATISDDVGIGTITNSTDSAPTFSLSATNATEGGSLKFTVNMSNASEQSHSVDYATSNGTASGNDYFYKSGTLTFAAGTTSKTVSVGTAQDAYYEANETVTLSLSGSTGGASIGTSSKNATILNDDAAPTFKVNNVSVSEGGSATFTITRTGYTRQPHYLSYATQDGSAKAGSDYTSKSGQAAFAPNTSQTATKTITVSTIENTQAESTEAFYLKLSNATHGATISDNSGTATISDDD